MSGSGAARGEEGAHRGSAPRARPFSLTADEIELVRASFDAAGFTEKSVSDTLGVPATSSLWSLSPEIAARLSRGPDMLKVLVRLFVVGLPCPLDEARAALSRPDLRRWIDGGLAVAGGEEVMAAVRLVPTEGHLLAFDRTWPGRREEPHDYVAGASQSTAGILKMMDRRPCDRLLDLGTGCGLIAFVASRHARQVIGSDVNPRAAAFAELNARLNGIANASFVTGSLYEAVADQRFDRIVANPPFVISPEHRVAYMDSGMRADEFCRRVAVEGAARLAEGGVLQMICDWIEPVNAGWDANLRSWFEGTGCDVWVLRSASSDPGTYARLWTGMGRRPDQDEDPDRLKAWLRYYEEQGVASIGQGFVTMVKRPGRNWVRTTGDPPAVFGEAGMEIGARMEALSFLERTPGDEELLGAVLSPSPKMRLMMECEPSAEGWKQTRARVLLNEGLGFVEDVDAYVAELIASFDGARPLREAIDRTAARLGWSAADVPSETPAIVRQLVEEGFLLPSKEG